MQSTNIPTKIPLPFAYAAGVSYIESIPSASQIGIIDGKASLHDGFPPLTFQAISLGGVPPFGSDFNGILNEITAITQWQQAGGMFIYDAAFSSTIGGYPKGAVLQKEDLSGMWLSTVENNINNPDTGGYGWISANVQSFNTRTGNVTLTYNDVTTALTYTPVNPNEFPNFLANSGYQKMPGGLIIQWGRSSTINGIKTVFFPIAFTTSAASITATVSGANEAGSFGVIEIGAVTTSSCTFWSAVFGTSGGGPANSSYNFNWIAIGW
jgi:hypothetical protein